MRPYAAQNLRLENLLHQAHDAEESVVYGSLLSLEGSGYSQPGTRIVINRRGQTAGILTGGCIEPLLCDLAAEVLKDERPRILDFSTGKQDILGDAIFGSGSGCGGRLKVLLEKLDCAKFSKDELEIFAQNNRTNSIPREILTLVSKKFFDNKDELQSVSAGEKNRDRSFVVGADDDWKNICADYAGKENDPLWIMRDLIPPLTSLFIVGAGDDAQALVSLAKYMGWRATVLDRRPAFAAAERFPDADSVISAPVADLIEHMRQNCASPAHTAVVVMSHNFVLDQEVMGWAIQNNFGYLGLMGSRKRTAQLTAGLKGSFFSPLGIDLPCFTPEHIALAAVAQIQQVIGPKVRREPTIHKT